MIREVENAYAVKHIEASAAVHELSQLIEDVIAPSESTHWGHVGDLARVNELLNQAVEILKGISC